MVAIAVLLLVYVHRVEALQAQQREPALDGAVGRRGRYPLVAPASFMELQILRTLREGDWRGSTQFNDSPCVSSVWKLRLSKGTTRS
jgi:hypothetical protein